MDRGAEVTAAGPPSGADLVGHPIARAVLVTVCERGYAEASVEEFLSRAGMTRAEFDCYFESRRAAIARVLDAYLAKLQERVDRAYRSRDTWPDNLRAAAHETARYLQENPALTLFVMLGLAEADPVFQAGRERLLSWAERLIDAGREVAADPASVPASAPHFAIGAVIEAIRRRHAEGGEIEMGRNLPWVMYAVVKPYLGEEAARAELAIGVPADLTAAS
jgi:AcrR family transcriptional regulator